MRPCVRWVGLELELAVENLDPPLASYFAFLGMAAGESFSERRGPVHQALAGRDIICLCQTPHMADYEQHRRSTFSKRRGPVRGPVRPSQAETSWCVSLDIQLESLRHLSQAASNKSNNSNNISEISTANAWDV